MNPEAPRNFARTGLLALLFLSAGLALAPLLVAAVRPRLEAPTAELPSASPARDGETERARSLSALLAARAEARTLAERLQPGFLGRMKPEEARSTGKKLVEAARRGGVDPAKILGPALPAPPVASALIASDRDLRDFRNAAEEQGPAAERYAEMAAAVPRMRPLLPHYEALLSGAWSALAEKTDASAASKLPGLTARKGELYVPSRKSLDRTHPYALDIFFTKVERFAGGVERGPRLHSVSRGIVLASARDWRGDAGWSSYRGGGFSPNSGNGAIVYDPETRRFWSYFHLSEVAVNPGDLIEPGTILGRGGDTGSNARKDGHGGHVHVEVYDARRNRQLRALEIRELLFGK